MCGRATSIQPCQSPRSGRYSQRDANAGVPYVEQKVSAVDVVDVTVVSIGPPSRPGLSEDEVITAVRKVPFAVDHRDSTDGKVVLPAKVSAEMFV